LTIFGRNAIYQDILRADQAKRARKAARAKQRAAAEGPDVKKRRISRDDDPEDEGPDAVGLSSDDGDYTEKKKGTKDDKPMTRSTPRKDKTLRRGLEEESPAAYKSPRRKPTTPRRHADDLAQRRDHGQDEDEDEDDLVMMSASKPKKNTPSSQKKKKVTDPIRPSEEEDSEEEDDYLRELKQRARDKARLQRLGVEVDRPRTPLAFGPANIRSPSTEQSRPASAHSLQDIGRTTPASEQEDDPEVKILIQSEIPDTRSLIVKRKASQSLKQVKEFWCRKWGLDEATTKTVFFTWRGTRLFDSTTMRGIILKLKKDHRQQSLGFDDADDDDDEDVKDPSGGNIMIEAMTQEIFDARQKRREHDTTQGSNTDDDEDRTEETGTSSRAAAAAAAAPESAPIVIRLVSKDHEPMPLRVRPHTTMAKIVRGFRAVQKIDDAKTVLLNFDGDPLDPDSTAEEVGLEDEDEVEVRIRD
jgi:hypothetical protein